MLIGVTRRSWPAVAAVAMSAGSLAASLAGCGSPARAATGAAALSLTGSQATAPGWRIAANLGYAGLAGDLSASGKSNAWLSEVYCAIKKCQDITTGWAGKQFRWNGTAWRSVTLPAVYASGTVISASATSNWIVGSVPVSKSTTRDAVVQWTPKGLGKATPLDKNVDEARRIHLCRVVPAGHALARRGARHRVHERVFREF